MIRYDNPMITDLFAQVAIDQVAVMQIVLTCLRAKTMACPMRTDGLGTAR